VFYGEVLETKVHLRWGEHILRVLDCIVTISCGLNFVL
jgi:hypothetical protein